MSGAYEVTGYFVQQKAEEQEKAQQEQAAAKVVLCVSL